MLDLSLPSGLRDLLPDHSAHLAELSSRLQGVFSRFGYRRVFLPTLERLDVVERGLSAAALADVMKFVEPGSGEVVAIRPDITPQIVRLYAARPDALPSPARLCYDGPVLRAREARAGRPREVYQAGVELLGGGGAAADAEALVLLAQGAAAGRAAPRGGGGRARPLRAGGDRRGAAARALRAPRPGRRSRARTRRRSPRWRRRAGGARRRARRCRCSRRSTATARSSAAARVARAVPGAAAALEEVEAALRLARRRGVGEVAIDLGEARGLGYYTGITFAGYAPGAGSAVAQGGRYDGLLARFGRPGPAIGFAVDLEFATQALERANGGIRGSRRPQEKARRGCGGGSNSGSETAGEERPGCVQPAGSGRAHFASRTMPRPEFGGRRASAGCSMPAGGSGPGW